MHYVYTIVERIQSFIQEQPLATSALEIDGYWRLIVDGNKWPRYMNHINGFLREDDTGTQLALTTESFWEFLNKKTYHEYVLPRVTKFLQTYTFAEAESALLCQSFWEGAYLRSWEKMCSCRLEPFLKTYSTAKVALSKNGFWKLICQVEINQWSKILVLIKSFHDRYPSNYFLALGTESFWSFINTANWYYVVTHAGAFFRLYPNAVESTMGLDDSGKL